MKVDSQNMLETLKSFPAQCREALSLPKGISVQNVDKVVVAGMGGSAISGNLLKSYMQDSNVPVFVSRDYKVPNFVDENTLVFAVSYSGDTEETLAAHRDAKEKNAKIIGITSGGKLTAECEKTIEIPAGLQPRTAVGYLFFPMLGILHNSDVVRVKNSELNEMLTLLKEVDDFNEEGKNTAKKLRDKIPIIYSAGQLKPVAHRWKTQLNENSKIPAFYNTFPEMNHNEIEGFKGMDMSFKVVMFRNKNDDERIIKRMDACKQIMEERAEVEEVNTQGESLLAKMFSTIYLGDFTSYHLALWRRVDPGQTNAIDSLKKKLAQ